MKDNWIKDTGTSLYNFVQLHMNLQLSQIKSLIKKNEMMHHETKKCNNGQSALSAYSGRRLCFTNFQMNTHPHPQKWY